MDFCGNFLTLRKRGFFWLDFFEGSARGVLAGNFFGSPQGRVFLWKFFGSPQGRGFVDHVVCVGNCVVCVLSVFVVGGWGWVVLGGLVFLSGL